MLSWDLGITSIIVAAAAYYVAHNIYKTIKGAAKGCSGGCSACAHRNPEHNQIGQKMAEAIELSKQRNQHR